MIETQTVDIRHVQIILKYCPNFDSIVSYEFEYGDNLSSKLVDWYREIVFSANADDERQLKVIGAIDKSLCLYVKDRRYKKNFAKVIKESDICLENGNSIKELIKKIIIFTNNYEKKKILEISNSKWL